VEERIKSGDARFCDSLELMIFLANLVGSEHIERFIPIAEPKHAGPPADDASDGSVSGTREMPKFAAHRPPAAGSTANSPVVRAEPKGGPVPDAREQVIADAVRLVQWGRKWYELPELVARMAGRPPIAEVRRILKENKPAIEEQAKN
jgi:hypothetical protein